MKKIYLILALAFSSTLMMGQYYVVPAINAGFNPGNLNSDIEEPSGALTPIGWTDITPTATGDAWSADQTVPFAFQFNGQSATSYKVSNTGVLTFTTGATAVPSDANATLPSSLIPDNSVLVWGLNLTGGNDGVLNKTFGSAPNRQHWVMYASATSGSAAYTYWSIVLEETTNNIYIIDQRTAGGSVSLTGGIQIDATTATMISGAALGSVGGGLNDASDNTFYEFVAGTVQPLFDMAAMTSTTPKVVQTGSAVNLSATFWNKGAVAAGTYDINYSINGGSTVTAAMTNSLAVASITDVAHPSAFTPSADGTYNIEMWLSNINGNLDENTANDAIVFTLSAVAKVPVRNVVIEEGTGTWCGWCPRGTVAMEYMKNTYADAITIAVHNGDPMTVTAYDAGLALSGYPGSRIDRGDAESVSQAGWDNLYQNRLTVVPGAEVNINSVWQVGADHIAINMNAEFVGTESNADYRFVAVVKEDGVTGTGSGYAQRNYYAGGGQGPMGGYESKPDPVPASQMVYDDVARAIHPSYEGQTGSVPASITAGQKVWHQMIVALPKTGTTTDIQDYDELTVVVMLLDGKTGRVVNADKKKLDQGTVGLIENDKPEFNMYPNPANNVVTINSALDASYEVYDLSGKVVAQGETFEKSATLNTADWTPGMYTVKLSSGTKVDVQKLSVLR